MVGGVGILHEILAVVGVDIGMAAADGRDYSCSACICC